MNLTLVKKVDEAKGTKSFFFNSETTTIWKPGQYIYITLPKLTHPDDRGETRHFTISSSPSEGELIKITTRLREQSGYKLTLDELQIGTVVSSKGLGGEFSFIPNKKANVFLAGGIGITPFRAIIKYNIDKHINTPIQLIYSNSNDDFVFRKELDIWQKENAFLKINYFDSLVSGHLDIQKLSSLIPSDQLNNINYYVVGPNKFVNAMEEILSIMKVSEDNILTEKFIGY